MQLLALVPAFFVFLYSFYRLIKDDYVLLRKNISLEQAFDVVLLVFIFGVVFSRALFFEFNSDKSNILLLFFSAPIQQFSLTGLVVGGLVGTYLVCKAKKAPIGRFADFISIAFLISLPFGFLFQITFIKTTELIPYVASSVIYLVLAIIFAKSLHKRLMNRTIREGKIAIIFLILFSLISLFYSVAFSYNNLSRFLDMQNFVLIWLFFFSIFLLIKQAITRRK